MNHSSQHSFLSVSGFRRRYLAFIFLTIVGHLANDTKLPAGLLLFFRQVSCAVCRKIARKPRGPWLIRNEYHSIEDTWAEIRCGGWSYIWSTWCAPYSTTFESMQSSSHWPMRMAAMQSIMSKSSKPVHRGGDWLYRTACPVWSRPFQCGRRTGNRTNNVTDNGSGKTVTPPRWGWHSLTYSIF